MKSIYNIFRGPSIQNFFFNQTSRCPSKLIKFTGYFDQKQSQEQNKQVTTGRPWFATELSVKSNEDLHKLWYVLLIEKNKLISDNHLSLKMSGEEINKKQIRSVKLSMARLLTVFNSRIKIQKQYRNHLEEEYLKVQREEYEKQLQQEAEEKKFEPKMPQVTHEIIYEKYRDLRQKIDNTDYLKRDVDRTQRWEDLKKELNEKYDYKNKKIVPKDYQGDETNVIKQFDSFFKKQLETDKYKVTEQEVLQAHVRNWKMLNLRQRRIIINLLQARRAKDAKKEFLNELSLLSQKIAYDNMQERLKTENQKQQAQI